MTDKFNQIINKATIVVTSQNNGHQYIPGLCNIGSKEREKRRVNSLMGGMFAFSWPFLCYVFALPELIKLVVIIPAIIGSINLMEYRMLFGAFLALSNKYDFSPEGLKGDVIEKVNQEKDQNKALNLLLISLGVSFAYTILVILLF